MKETRAPVQKRGIRTREKILKAAQRLFSQRGYHGVNSNEIAAAAGVATGSFYAYFGDKKRLFLETMKRYNQEVMARIMQDMNTGIIETAGNERRDIVRSMVLRAIAAHDYNPAFHREMTAMMYSDAEVLDAQAAEDANVLRAITAVLEKQAGMLRIQDPGTAAWIIYRSTEGVVHHLRMPGGHPDQKKIIDGLTDMLCRYLFM